MSDINDTCLDTFPLWLRSLGEDVRATLGVAASEELDKGAQRQLVAGINYVFKSMDLIPDGINDIGFLDDALVLRVAARVVGSKALQQTSDEKAAAVNELGDQCELIRSFLGEELYDRLVRYTKEQSSCTARGRSVEEIVEHGDVWREFASEVREFVQNYESPAFAREERNLIKLKAFFEAKLPR